MITIGRSSRSSIRVDQRYDTVSNDHANIEQQGNVLVFYDHSSNGTVINGQKIHNNHVNIYPGDKIMLAGVYELDWGQIKGFFPSMNRPTVETNVRGGAYDSGRKTVRINNDRQSSGGQRMTERFDNNQQSYQGGRNYGDPYGGGMPQPPVQNNYESGRHVSPPSDYGRANSYSQAEIEQAINKWNWGAFFCSWIWAAFHRTYWPMFILLVMFIPYVGQVCSLCLCVYLGMKGSKIAWECGKYRDFDSYKRAQQNWLAGGLIWFILSIGSSAFIVYYSLMMF